jgi:hypothetical protein
MIVWPTKGPTEAREYEFEFGGADPVLQTGEAIVSKTVVADGVTVDSSAIVGSQVQLVLSAGVAGTVATVTCTVVTDSTPPEIYSKVAVLEIGGDAISLAMAKAHRRIDTSDDDVLLAQLLRAATSHIEAITGKYLSTRIVTQTIDGFPGSGCTGAGGYWVNGYPGGYFVSSPPAISGQAIRLWRGPASSIVSIKYDDANGVEQTLSSFRLVDGRNAQLLPAYGAAWPVTAVGPGSVRLTYIAGYDPAELPSDLVQAALMMFAHLDANREAVAVSERSGSAIEVPFGVDMLTAPYRAPGIA